MDHHAKIKIAILHSLKRMPKTYTQRDEVLRAEVCLDVQPRPTLLEIEDALTVWNNPLASLALAMN